MASLANPPPGEYLKWVIEHPEQVAAYLETVRALQKLTVNVTYAATRPTGSRQFSIAIGPENSVLSITA